MQRLSVTLEQRLHRRLALVRSPRTFGPLELALSAARFDNPREFRTHLSEGALLNVSALASRALSIPSGEYVVWSTDTGTTVLVPTNVAADPTKAENPTYQIRTDWLLGNWNRIERVITERQHQGADNLMQGNREAGAGARPALSAGERGHYDAPPEEDPDGEPYTFGSDVDNNSLWQAMQRQGVGVVKLATMVGVDRSTISRLLRHKQGGPGDPHGRDPSVALAQDIADALGCDVEEVLPSRTQVQDRDRKATSGSGRGGAGSTGRRGSSNYTAGNQGSGL